MPDVAVLVELEAACFPDAWPRSSLQSTLEDDKSFVMLALDDGVVAGYATAWTLGDEGELPRIAVLPQFRGRGIGEALLRAAMQECRRRGAGALFLEVRQSNQAARRLYEKCGFHEVGRRRRYYQDGEDACIYKAVLPDSSTADNAEDPSCHP